MEKLISIPITTGSYSNVITRILNTPAMASSYVCVANVHMLVEAYMDKKFSAVLDKADFVLPDGMPLVWGLKLLHGKRQDRIAGMDLLPKLLEESQARGLSVFFYGGTPEMLAKSEEYLKMNYPTLNIAGMYSPPFRALSVEEENEVIDTINKSNPKFVFVVLGCPKQERWMHSMKDKINACMIGIGGALPVMIGLQSRAPLWMQKNGLEWLYRFIHEPKRLFKRYAITNTVFIWLMLKAFLRKIFGLSKN